MYAIIIIIIIISFICDWSVTVDFTRQVRRLCSAEGNEGGGAESCRRESDGILTLAPGAQGLFNPRYLCFRLDLITWTKLARLHGVTWLSIKCSAGRPASLLLQATISVFLVDSVSIHCVLSDS